jgi:hypothetical protein
VVKAALEMLDRVKIMRKSPAARLTSSRWRCTKLKQHRATRRSNAISRELGKHEHESSDSGTRELIH